MTRASRIDDGVTSINGSMTFEPETKEGRIEGERGRLRSYTVRISRSYEHSHRDQQSCGTLLLEKLSKIEVDTFEAVRCVDWTEPPRDACRDVSGVEPGSWGRR
jgi:hypothetical protein